MEPTSKEVKQEEEQKTRCAFFTELSALEIALRGTDVKTTASLTCVSKGVHTALSEYDLWKLKFETEFNSIWYQPQWTARDNYRLQKKGGVMQFAVAKPDTSEVDFMLYVPCVRRTRLVGLLNYESLRGELCPFEMAEIDFRQPLARYALFHSVCYDRFTLLSSFATRKEAATAVYETCFAKEENRDLFLLVDLTTLVLEFSMPKRASEAEMAAIEREARAKFWFCDAYDVDGAHLMLEEIEKELDCSKESEEK